MLIVATKVDDICETKGVTLMFLRAAEKRYDSV